MVKVLITGSAGFIGMHASLKLVEMGFDVVGMDNVNEYYEVGLKYSRLQLQGIKKEDIAYGKLIQGNEKIKFIKLDLEDKEGILKLFEAERFDYVINLAAQAGVRYSLTNPDAYISSNVTGFLNILEACRNFPVQHLLFASSSSVYGLNTSIPFKESDATEHPLSLYAASKKANEMMAHSYSHLFKIPVTGLRFFTVYGPWGRPDMALFMFTKNIISGEAINVFNNGDMHRDFTYVDDIINGVVKIMVNIPDGKVKKDSALSSDESSAKYSIFNIGNSKPVKLMDFIYQLEEELDKKAIINYMPIQPGDVKLTYADTNKLQSEVTYTPSTSIKEGIKQFTNWYKSYYKV
ncbi:MAG: GDP-mannose 4,6-dehydratase [Bacteroidota bacterium]|nr:GDP-mannose 4,6-dehydratase [Bacteroidota bacterium]